MTSLQSFNFLLLGMVGLAGVVLIALHFFPAGYGRFVDARWGRTIDNRMGWVVMELPVVVVFGALWLGSERSFAVTPLTFFLLFNLHYLQRTFVFPFLLRGRGSMPLSIIVFGMLFNVVNAILQGSWIFYLAPDDLYAPAWLASPQFAVGLVLFLGGFAVNLHSDHIIRGLRRPGDNAHHIPRGGLFEYVSSANYLGELIEWIGWAVLTWSWSGLVFAVWTFANLGPRARANHSWYIEKFGADYPRDRKRLIPFIY